MRLFIVGSLLLGLVTGMADGQEAAMPLEQVEGPIRVVDCNDGRRAHRYLEDRRGGQDVALWVASETKVVRGLLLSLHQGSEAYRTDLQQLARAMDFAVAGTLIRWDGFEQVLPDQFAKLSSELGHPEIANVPWVGLGVSRNVGALLNFARLGQDGRMLCFLFAGGPGAGIKLDDSEDVKRFSTIPILSVNGPADPFVDGMNWQHKVFPQIRKKELPFTVAVDWGEGHSFKEGLVLAAPFIQAVYDHRVPADADQTKGPIELKPMRYEDGWLVGPVNWDDTFGPELAKVSEFKGDKQQAVWLPDERTGQVWRAFHAKEEPAVEVYQGKLAVKPQHAGHELVVSERDAVSIAWTVKDKQPATQPVLVVNGVIVDIDAGHRAGQQANTPANAIQLGEEAGKTLETLINRREADVPSQWRVVFRDDFESGLDEAWYEYYQRSAKERDRKMDRETQMKAVDGRMQLSGNLHVVAMLPYDWPNDVAVEYKVKPISEKVCDASVVLSGNPSGSAFPWRSGMMFHFGAHFNQGSFFIVHEQPHKDWQPHDSGARISREWQTVRVERLNGIATATIDGKKVAERTISDHDFERFFGRKIGLYTFGSTVQFDDVTVAVRMPKDPAAVEPKLPTDAAMDRLAQELADKLRDPFSQQRWAADRLIQQYSGELAPAMRRLIERGQLAEEGTRKKLQQLLDAMPPDEE